MTPKKGRDGRKQARPSPAKRKPVKHPKPKPPKPVPSPGVPIGKGSFEHIVIILKENHTFDCYFGTFPGAEGDSTLAHASDPPTHPSARFPTIMRRGSHALKRLSASNISKPTSLPTGPTLNSSRCVTIFLLTWPVILHPII